jgi:hypothetical protein
MVCIANVPCNVASREYSGSNRPQSQRFLCDALRLFPAMQWKACRASVGTKRPAALSDFSNRLISHWLRSRAARGATPILLCASARYLRIGKEPRCLWVAAQVAVRATVQNAALHIPPHRGPLQAMERSIGSFTVPAKRIGRIPDTEISERAGIQISKSRSPQVRVSICSATVTWTR